MKRSNVLIGLDVVVAILALVAWWHPLRRPLHPPASAQAVPDDLPSAPPVSSGSAVRPVANIGQAPANVDRRADLPGHEARQAALEPARASRRTAAERLRALVPGVKVDFDETLGSPRFIASNQTFLTGAVPAERLAGFSADDPQRMVKAFLDEHAGMFGHGSAVLGQAELVRDYETAHNGLHTYVWQQELDGVRVFESTLQAHVTKGGDLVNVASRLVPDVAAAAPNHAAALAAPKIDVKTAIGSAGADIGETVATAQIAENAPPAGPSRKQQFRSARLLDVSAEYVWLPEDETALRLCWEVVFTSKARGEMFRSLVAADTGEVLVRHSLTEYISNASYRVFTSDSPTPFSPGHATPNSAQPPLVPRVLVTTPALNTTASPNGWIDDGVNETRGNNVDAHTDTNADNVADLPRPQGSPNRVFDFALDLAQAPSTNQSAAVTQLFYWCNFIHDKLYELGFTEAAGNFQVNNFGRGGVANDAVQADAQDGSGTNNANFSTPADGSSGRMQMFLWTGPTPDIDGDFDAEVVLHEYTHGLTNRLVGGGVGISALQPQGMGEGWSDFYGIALLAESGDDINGNWARGGYSRTLYNGTFTENYYFGGRRYPYSTSLTKNPLTFKDIDPTKASAHTGIPVNPNVGSTPDEVHNMGEVWCVTLWDVRANLINKHGFAIGHQLAMQLITDGLKLAPANPTFLQARDGILQAEMVLTAGANRGQLWSAFAKRGMGVNATSPISSTASGVVEDFAFPDDLGVSPSGTVTVTGTVGGPFASTTFTVVNSGTAPLTRTAAKTQPWLALSSAGGTLAGGTSTTVIASFPAAASVLSAGQYSDTITFTNVTSSVVQTRAVSLTVERFSVPIASEDWESGAAGAAWTITGTSAYRTLVTNANTPHGGSYHLTMDSSTASTLSRNEATWTVNLAGRDHVILQFWVKMFGDEPHGPPAAPFVGGADFDGVAISADGTNWYEVQPLRTLVSAWTRYQVDLDAAIAARGLSYNSAFKIRFNHYDDNAIATDGFAFDDILLSSVFDNRLTLSLPVSADENGAPLTGTITAQPVPQSDLVVALSSNVAAQLGVPASVTIPAGQASANFALTPVDDALLNGSRPITLTATAGSPWPGTQAAIVLQDNETATLSVDLPASATEGAGTVTGTVHLSAAPDVDVNVTLTSSDAAELTVPTSVLIPAGQTTATFPVTIVDDTGLDGVVTTTVTASMANWTSGSADLAVSDNESATLTLTLPASVREGDAPGSGKVQIGGSLAVPLVVTLLSVDASELTLPATVTIAAGQTSALFSVTIVDDTERDGTQSLNVTARATGFADSLAPIAVADNDVDHFVLGAVASPQIRNQAFPLTVTAKDVNDATITNYNTATALSGSVAVTPSSLTGWVNGVWTGNVTATAYGTNVTLTVSSAGRTGVSNAFDVTFGTLTKLAWSTIPSPQTRDTFFSTTVTAQDSVGNPVTTFNGTATLQAQLSNVSQLDVGTGTATWDYPLYTVFHDSRTQVIYLASELGGPRRIKSLAFNVTALPGQTLNNWTIRMKHTTQSSYSSGSWDASGWTTVYQANETITQTGWVTFNFSAPFDYDGTSNLLIDSSFNNTNYMSSGSVQATIATTSRSIYYYSDSSYGDPLTWSGTAVPSYTSTYVPNLRLGFLATGGTIPVDPPVTGNFVNGVWSGQVSVPLVDPGVSLIAQSGANLSGTSNAFVVQAPTSGSGGGSGTVFSDDFESGVFSGAWTITGTGNYRTQITTYSAHGGAKHMAMDEALDSGSYARNEATLTVNLAGRTGAVLSFWAVGFAEDSNGPPSSPFPSTGADFDGVAISADGGINWYEVQGLRGLGSSYTQYTVNLDTAIAAKGLVYSSNFKIRFNQYDNFSLGTDGIGIDDILITAVPSATLTVTLPAQASEGAGTVSGSVKLPSAAGSATVVNLSSSAPARISVPAAITVLSGQTTASFGMTVRDNAIIDGDRSVVIAASTAAANGSGTLTVVDNDTATLSLSAPASVAEGATGITGTATLSAAPSVALTFTLSSTIPAAATVPGTLTFNPGQTSVTFPITIVDDLTLDGDQTTTITASATGWTSATSALTVLDNETGTVSLTLASATAEGNAPLTGTVALGFTPADTLAISLTSDDPSEITVPATVNIAAGSRTATFLATVVDDTDYDGAQIVTVSATAAGLTGDTKIVTVADNELHHFALSPVANPRVRNGAFTFTVTAKDINDGPLTNYSATTPLTATAGGVPVGLSRATLSGWTGGVWSGPISITEYATGVTLTVAPGTAAQTTSNVFDVVLGPVDHFVFSTVGAAQTQRTPFSVVVTAQDEGNNLVTSYAGPATLDVVTPEPVQVLSWVGYADTALGGEYLRTKQAITNSFPYYTETSTTVTDPAQLATLLQGKHVFLVPEQENVPALTMNTLGTAWATVLSNFVNSGGVVVVCSYQKDEHLLLVNSGLMTATKGTNATSATWSKVTDTVLTTGITAPLFTAFDSSDYTASNGTVSYRNASTTNPVVLSRDVGLGHVALIGSDFASTISSPDRVLANAVGGWVKTPPVVVGTPAPAATGQFVNGVWSGTVGVPMIGSNLRLLAGDGAGHVGQSNPFIVTVRTNPTITAIVNEVIDEDSATAALGFTVGDNQTPVSALVVTAASSDPVLVPASGIVLDGASADRTVKVTPAPDAHGTVQITLTVTDSDGRTDSTQFMVTVNEVNDAPAFVAGSDVAVLEGAPAQVVAGWATGLSAGPADESLQSLDFVVSSENTALFSEAPVLAPNGTLSFKPAPGANGSALVTVQLHDNGGTARGGLDTSAPQTFTIAVTPVNDPPSFVRGGDQAILEDAGPQTIAAWATQISAGPPDESGQSLDFIVSVDHPELFDAAPAIASNGALTFATKAEVNGSASVSVRLHDDGGGADTSPGQSFSITISAVNDAPSFTKGANQTVGQNVGSRSIAGWATGILAGPADETLQALHFVVTSDHSELFATAPALAADGTLTFTPAADKSGTAIVSVALHDDGGTANGGVDHSAVQTFTITTGFVNDAPTFVAGQNLKVAQDAGPQVMAGWATQISAGPSDEAEQTLDFIVSADPPELFAAGPAIARNGTLTFAPAATASGIATITVRLHDNGGSAAGGSDTSTAKTFTIAITSYAEELGTYNGLVRGAAGAPLDAAHMGLIRVSAVRNGGLSGRLVLGGVTKSFKGALDQAGNAHFGAAGGTTFLISRRGDTPLHGSLKIDVTDDTDTLTGTIHDGVGSFAVFTADRAIFTARAAAPPLRNVPEELVGAYTVVFKTPTAASGDFPEGAGSGTAMVKPDGSVRLAGTLADGTKVGYANALSKGRVWPFYHANAKGYAITGPVIFEDVPATSDLDGAALRWFHAPGKGTFYPGGWPAGILTDLIGSKYVPPAANASMIPGLPAPDGDGNAAVTFTNGGLDGTLTQPILISAPDRAAALFPNGNKVTVSLARKTGLFKGKFTHPQTGKSTQFSGAVLQKQSAGLGAFRTKIEAGNVRLTPQ